MSVQTRRIVNPASLRSAHGQRRRATTTPTEWWDSAFERRIRISVANTSGSDRNDALVGYTLPAGVSISAASLRVVETTSAGTIDRAYDWRYQPNATTARNHLPLLPASISGGVVTFKALGRWQNNETRYFALYWSDVNSPSAATFNHLAISGVSAPYYQIGRTGPDTSGITQYYLGLPSSANASATNLLTIGRLGVTQLLRLFHYRVNGDATDYGAITATQDTVTVDGPTITVSGTITCSTRSAAVDWSGTYTAVYQHRWYLGDKTNGLAAKSLPKHIDLCHFTYTMTCQRAYNPPTDSGGNAITNTDVLQVTDTGASYTGNVTIEGANAIPNFYQTSGGSLTSVASSANLSAVTVGSNLILGAAGNAHALGVRVNSITLSNFGTQTPSLRLFATSTPQLQVMIAGLVNSKTIPIGATIAADLWYAHHTTPNGTTTGDVLMPYELVDVLTNADWAPTVTRLATERYADAVLAQTMHRAGTRAVQGVTWFQSNATALTTVSSNYGYQYNVKSAAVTTPDDDDGNYGEAHKLHGLCLRYLRTHDSALVALIENQVQWHLDIEAAAIAAYGSWWSGATPYWYWPSATSSGSAYTTEGGCSEASNTGATPNALIDPNWAAINGGTYGLGSITYTQGQVRRKHSIDQSHMVTHGLFAYLYLLRGEAAITANTTLRANALTYLNRMKLFEADKYTASSRVIDNAYAICNGASFGSASHNNGINATLLNTESGSSLANPYYGQYFGTWNVSNTNGSQADASSNVTIDAFFRAAFAPDSVESGVRRFMQGQAMDMLLLDLSRHDVERGSTLSTKGVIGAYRDGWNTRAGISGNTTRYAASRDLGTVPSNNGYSTDLHWFRVDSTGSLDHLSGRAAQRAIALAFVALLDPTYTIPVEMSGASVLRSVNVVTALNDQVRTLALYGHEPTTNAQRFAVAGYFGKSTTYDPQIVDSAFTGYWMMAIELWHLVQMRVIGINVLPTYYRFAGI